VNKETNSKRALFKIGIILKEKDAATGRDFRWFFVTQTGKKMIAHARGKRRRL